MKPGTDFSDPQTTRLEMQKVVDALESSLQERAQVREQKVRAG